MRRGRYVGVCRDLFCEVGVTLMMGSFEECFFLRGLGYVVFLGGAGHRGFRRGIKVFEGGINHPLYYLIEVLKGLSA